jgi:dipeptidyl aminopeptidase/acylaminoacyl peptidase
MLLRLPLKDSEILEAALAETGVRHDLVVIKGGDHGFRDPAHRGQAMNAMIEWFKQHL